MPVDPIKDPPRLSDEAMGPCVWCERQLLATELLLFWRIKIQCCGIDAGEVRRHVGLAASIAAGRDGLALARIMGPGVKPVVVIDQCQEVNFCNECAGRFPLEVLAVTALQKASQ